MLRAITVSRRYELLPMVYKQMMQDEVGACVQWATVCATQSHTVIAVLRAAPHGVQEMVQDTMWPWHCLLWTQRAHALYTSISSVHLRACSACLPWATDMLLEGHVMCWIKLSYDTRESCG